MAEGRKKDPKRVAAFEWGRLGEQLVREYLAGKGFAVTESNWKSSSGNELDIISQQGDEMVFIEVKTRNGRFGSAEDAIDLKKIRRIVKAANAYLQALDRPFDARFDVALVEGSPSDYDFTYIENAFVPPLNGI